MVDLDAHLAKNQVLGKKEDTFQQLYFSEHEPLWLLEQILGRGLSSVNYCFILMYPSWL